MVCAYVQATAWAETANTVAPHTRAPKYGVGSHNDASFKSGGESEMSVGIGDLGGVGARWISAGDTIWHVSHTHWISAILLTAWRNIYLDIPVFQIRCGHKWQTSHWIASCIRSTVRWPCRRIMTVISPLTWKENRSMQKETNTCILLDLERQVLYFY